METLDFFASKMVSALANLCTIVTAMVAILLFIYKFFKQKSKNGFKKSFSLFLFVLIVVLFLGSILLLALVKNNENNNKYLWEGIMTFVLSVVLFGMYAFKAFKSLDKNSIDNILPPAMFWQMFFNKIPARVVNADSNNITFAVVKMDDCDEVNDSAKIILQSHENKDKDKFCIKVIDGFKRKGKEKYEYNLNKILEDCGLSGVIFLIGASADNDDQIKQLTIVIDEFSNIRREIPIGYVKSGNKRNFSLHYEEIREDQLSDCVHHLIMRGYIRSKMQFDLGNAYHKSCILLSILLIASLIGVYQIATSDDNRYIRPKVLSNDVYPISNPWEGVIIPAIMNDSVSIQKVLDSVSNYYFKDLNSYLGVKIWLKNESKDSLYCVYSDMWKKGYNYSKVIPDSYCVGQVARHRLFFLWPGVFGDSTHFHNNTKVVWTYHGDFDKKNDNYVKNGKLDIKKRYWSGQFFDEIDSTWSEDTLRWMPSSKEPDKELAAFCFSYDGCLVLEIDCRPLSLASDYDYMSHLMFRNSVRKYVNFVYYFLRQDKYKLSK